MKNILHALNLAIVLMVGLHGEEAPLIKEIDSLTLQEVKGYLERDVESMEDFLKLAENNNINFIAPSSETTEPIFSDKTYRALDTDINNAKIDKFLSKMYLRQYIDYPKSAILMNLESGEMQDIFDAKRSSKDFPSISVQSIKYIDKSQEKVKLETKWEDYNDLYVDVSSSKPIESMKMKMAYTFPLIKEYYLSKAKPIVLKEGTIKLENMAGGKVQFSLSSDALKEKIIVVDAIHAKGKSLRKKSESMYSHPSKANIAYMKKTIILLKEITGHIENNGLFSSLFGEKSIDSKEALKDALRKIPKQTKEERKQTSFWTYGFSGNIDKVRIVINRGRTAKKTKEVVVKKHPRMHQSSLGYYVARDSQTKKEGFVGRDGEWLVQPMHSALSYMNDYYYRGEYKNDSNQLYWLNTKKNILEPVDYLIYRNKLIDGELLMTQKIRNSQRGVVNVKTGKIVVPMEYDNVVFENGFFIADVPKNKKYYVELFSKEGKHLIKKESKYNSVKTFAVGCVVATRDGEHEYDDKIDILNKNGEILSKGQWNRFHGVFGKSKLLLVERWKQVSEKEKNKCDWGGYNGKFYCVDKVAYINPKGKVALNASRYYEAKEFSNGLAAVRDRKTKLWGYIDTRGNLSIPCQYKHAQYFQEKYAYVAKGDKEFLIDKKNRIHVRLPNGNGGNHMGLDANTAIYYRDNGESYDANGALIKKNKKGKE